MGNPFDPPTFDGVLPKPDPRRLGPTRAADPPTFDGILPRPEPGAAPRMIDPDGPPSSSGLPDDRETATTDGMTDDPFGDTLELPPLTNGTPAPAPRRTSGSHPMPSNPVRLIPTTEPGEPSPAEAAPSAAPLFEQLSLSHSRLLRNLGRIVRFLPGDALLQAGQGADALWLVQQGRVGIRGPTREGTVGPGDVLGELALFGGLTWAATAEALDPVVALRIPLDRLRESGRQPAVLSLCRRVAVRLARELVGQRPPKLPGVPLEPVGAALLGVVSPQARAFLAGPEGLVGISKSEQDVLLDGARVHRYTGRGAIPLGDRVLLVLEGVVELGPPGSERTPVGRGNWVGLVDRLADADPELAVVTPGSQLLEVSGPAFDAFWEGHDPASIALVRAVGSSLSARLVHAEQLRPEQEPDPDRPPSSAGISETMMETAYSPRGARGLPGPPALLHLR